MFEIRTVVPGPNALSESCRGRNSWCKAHLASVEGLEALLRRASGMNAQRRITATLIGCAMMGTVPVFADSTTATMQVSVQVIARAIVSVDSQPVSVTITSDDIARGYVDVQAPIMVRVRTNSRQGYMLQVENQSETFSSIELTSGNVEMHVGDHESWIQRPYVAGGDLMPMRARLHLSQAAVSGTFAVPIAFTASPL